MRAFVKMKKDEQARKRTAKSGKKKQSNLRQCQHCKKEGGGAGIGAGVL
jgi:hypothetical protein